MNRLQEIYANHIESVCRKFNCMEAASLLKEGFSALCEAETGSTSPAVSVEPGWPDSYAGTDCASAFPECRYAPQFFAMLREKLEALGTMVFPEPVCAGEGLKSYPGSNMVDHLRMAGLDASECSAGPGHDWNVVTLRVPMTGTRKGMPVMYACIGEFSPLGNNYEIRHTIRWVPRGFIERFGEDAPMNRTVTVTPENMAEIADGIAGRAKWMIDRTLDLDVVGTMLGMHRKWLTRRGRNVTDTEVGRLFVERFRSLSESTPVQSGKDWRGRPYEIHTVGIRNGSELNRVGVNKMEIYALHGEPFSPYMLRCTSDGYVVLVGSNSELDIETVVLTRENWEELCDAVFSETCELEKAGVEVERKKQAAARERESHRVMSDRNRIKAKFGDFLYNKFFDVVDDGELAGKSTDEIITDMKCAIAEDRAEYDLMAKQDMIRSGRE